MARPKGTARRTALMRRVLLSACLLATYPFWLCAGGQNDQAKELLLSDAPTKWDLYQSRIKKYHAKSTGHVTIWTNTVITTSLEYEYQLKQSASGLTIVETHNGFRSP